MKADARTLTREDVTYMMTSYKMVSKTKDKIKKETLWVLEYVGARTYPTKKWLTGEYTAVTIPA